MTKETNTAILTPTELSFLDFLENSDKPIQQKQVFRQNAKFTEDGLGVLWMLGVIEPNTNFFNTLKSLIRNFDKNKGKIDVPLNIRIQYDFTNSMDKVFICDSDYKELFSFCMPTLLDDFATKEQKESLFKLYKKESDFYSKVRFDNERFTDVVFRVNTERQEYVIAAGK